MGRNGDRKKRGQVERNEDSILLLAKNSILSPFIHIDKTFEIARNRHEDVVKAVVTFD